MNQEYLISAEEARHVAENSRKLIADLFKKIYDAALDNKYDIKISVCNMAADMSESAMQMLGKLSYEFTLDFNSVYDKYLYISWKNNERTIISWI